ncbi:unnamed protein product [Onchocerca flexuosa]|uniref:Reverse transcriptase domain-containing protein n=1 Tax=Onchocerca flexuosa TaxID=387005 RepID=A0A183I108_9BILA|nr:unnamed protein product [Onchocerca flexuosa]
MKMISELLHGGNNTSSESNSPRMKNIGENMKSTVERMIIEANKISDKLKRTDEQQKMISTTGTTINSITTKQLMHHRFSVNDILSPLNNIGK